MNEYLVAFIITLNIFFIVRIFKNIQRFNKLNKIKKQILVFTTVYVIENEKKYFIKYKYRNYIYKKLEENKLGKWVESIDLRWINETKFIVSFDMVYNNIRMKFEYPMDIKELKINNTLEE